MIDQLNEHNIFHGLALRNTERILVKMIQNFSFQRKLEVSFSLKVYQNTSEKVIYS